jgi:hypothetical protein
MQKFVYNGNIPFQGAILLLDIPLKTAKILESFLFSPSSHLYIVIPESIRTGQKYQIMLEEWLSICYQPFHKI